MQQKILDWMNIYKIIFIPELLIYSNKVVNISDVKMLVVSSTAVLWPPVGDSRYLSSSWQLQKSYDIENLSSLTSATKENHMEIIKIILAIILPPLGVFLQVGIGKHFWINIILTILGYIPGIVHAIWVIAKNK